MDSKIHIKKIKQTIFILSLLLIPMLVYANWEGTKGWFEYQKDIVKAIPNNAAGAQANIFYAGKIWNFMWSDKSTAEKVYAFNQEIVVSTLTHRDNPNKLELTCNYEVQTFKNATDHYKKREGFNTPLPLIFKNNLFLLWENSDGDCISRYNSEDSIWTTTKIADNLGYPKTVAVVDGKAVLPSNDKAFGFFWSDDLIHWNEATIDSPLKNADSTYPLSSIATTVVENGEKKQILMVGYIDVHKKDKHHKKGNLLHAMYATYEFDDNDNLIWREHDSGLISSSDDFSSIAFAEGSVKKDPSSSGHCIQAFIKHDNTDNTNLCYRIERYEFKNGEWSQRENNLVPQKNQRAWADKNLNLSAVNYIVPEGDNDMKQYMCLIYRGYDNVDHPLNCAWAETDKFVWQGDTTQKMTYEESPEYVQYIGYFEGTPPFYLNGEPDSNPYMHEGNGLAISRVNYKSSIENSTDKDTDWQAGMEINTELAWFRGEINGAFHRKHTTEVSTTITQIHGLGSTVNFRTGKYILVEPTYKRDHYFLQDTKGNIIDSLYYYSIIKLDQNTAEVKLAEGLDPSDPTTYLNRDETKKLSLYTEPSHHFGSQPYVSFDWTPTNTEEDVTQIKVDKKNATSNGGNGSIMLGFGNKNEEKHSIFDIGIKGEIDIMTTASTSDENEMEIQIFLNEPIETMTDQCTKLNVNTYWLKPNHTEGVDNWWLPEGAKWQDTWCITYVVTEFVLDKYPSNPGVPSNGENIADEGTEEAIIAPDEEKDISDEETKSAPKSDIRMEELLEQKTSLFQNYPNPFSSITKIQYRIGEKNLQDDTSDGATRLVVYEFNGKEVATLVNGNQSEGIYEVEWDASNHPPGVYLYSLQNGDYREVKKLILMK
jgi:hypothetical protein